MQRDRPFLIVVGSSGANFRSYIFESISARYRLWLLSPTMPAWAEPYVESFTIVDCLDKAELAAAANRAAVSCRAVGVFCYDETLVEHAAHVSTVLGFTTWEPAAIARCRDKSATRAALWGAGLLQPRSKAVATLSDARAFAAEVGYPVILKPRNLAGSVGVRKAEGPGELSALFEDTGSAAMAGFQRFDRHVLVEEFIEGPEIAVDSVFFEGRCEPIVVAHKVLGDEPPFEFDERGHDVSADDPLLSDPDLTDTLARSHAAVGFRNGVSHTEFKLTTRGLYLIEINARMGGDLIPYLGYLASGYDESLAAADVAAGRPPAPVVRTRHRAASIRFAIPSYAMEVTAASVREELVRPPVHRALLAVQPGRVLQLPPKAIARLGCVIAVSDTVEEARGCVADPGRFFDVTGRPLAEVTA